jgi:hypothetical protein
MWPLDAAPAAVMLQRRSAIKVAAAYRGIQGNVNRVNSKIVH